MDIGIKFLNPPVKLGGIALKNALTSDTNCRVEGFLRPYSGSIIHQENVRKAVIIVVMALGRTWLVFRIIPFSANCTTGYVLF